MKIKRFRVTKYKCVMDSNWVDVTPLTVLVGKNESGKTSLLRALHKFNPFSPEPYSIPREWPRGHRGERSDAQVVCLVEFELDDDEIAALGKITPNPVKDKLITVSKDYAGRFEVGFPEDVFPKALHPNDIDAICESLPQPVEPIAPAFAQAAAQCRQEAVRLAREGKFDDLAGLAEKHKPLLAQQSPENPPMQNEANHAQRHLAQLGEVSRKLKASPTVQQKAHEFVIKALPTFVYMDEYRTFSGMALLNQVKQRKDQGKLNEDDKTLLTIMALSELDLDEECTKAEAKDKEERQYDLSDAAATLNTKIEKHWRQLRYQVDFRGDGQQFMTFVRGQKDAALIRLEERSKGFQWFFSFDLMLMHETQGTLRNCVILLDEPGLHLHPEAQVDLLDRLAAYAEGNTLIYTTHLPFMIDLEQPERIRIISETDKGTCVTDDLTKSQPEAKLVLQAALGIGGRTSYLVADRNLVVEGVDDYWILAELSNLMRRSGEPGLPDDVMVTPAGGASEATYIATFMIGQSLDVVALYDADDAGRKASDKLIKNWLTRYKDRHANAISLGPACGVSERDFSIEDLFAEAYYLGFVQQTYAKALAAAGVNKIELPEGQQLVKRVEQFMQAQGIQFNKGSVCKRLRAAMRETKDTKAFDSETIGRVRQLFKAIADAFPKDV